MRGDKLWLFCRQLCSYLIHVGHMSTCTYVHAGRKTKRQQLQTMHLCFLAVQLRTRMLCYYVTKMSYIEQRLISLIRFMEAHEKSPAASSECVNQGLQFKHKMSVFSTRLLLLFCNCSFVMSTHTHTTTHTYLWKFLVILPLMSLQHRIVWHLTRHMRQVIRSSAVPITQVGLLDCLGQDTQMWQTCGSWASFWSFSSATDRRV